MKSDEQIDLNPYGKMPQPRMQGQFFLYDDPAAAANRAVHKIRRYLASEQKDRPAGKSTRFLIITLVVGIAVLLSSTVPILLGGTWYGAVVGVPFAVYFIVFGIRSYDLSGVTTAAACARQFCAAINRADFHRAYRIVAPLDKDGYLRPRVTSRETDPNDVEWFDFSSFEGFEASWSWQRVLDSGSRLHMKTGEGLTYLTPDIAVVDMLLEVQRSLRLQSSNQTTSIRRLVLRYGNEWRLFNGDALPSDELDKQWLDRLLAEARKDRAE